MFENLVDDFALIDAHGEDLIGSLIHRVIEPLKTHEPMIRWPNDPMAK
jgi:hypothetical protein